MPKHIFRKSAADPASIPLFHPPREHFAQALARGVPAETAYKEAGYKGNARSRKALRTAPDLDARVRWLLNERIRADAAIRAKAIQRESDARRRLIAELESVAYVDIGDIVQWDRQPRFDAEGALAGWEEVVEITPSKHLTKAQRAAVKTVQRTVRKDGTTLRIDTNGKLEALGLLAKILGLTQPDAAPGPSTTINATQINVAAGGGETAMDAARRLAFALERAARALPPVTETRMSGPVIDLEASPTSEMAELPSHAPDAGSKG